MDIKELLAKCEDVESKISEDDEDDELGLYIINTRRMYDKYCQPAMEKIRAGKGDEIDWRRIAIEGARMYAREIEPLHLDGEGYKATAEYLKDYYTNLAGDPIDEGMEEKPADMEKAEYKDMKIEKPEVEKAPKLNEEVAEKLNFKLGDADIEVTNDTKTEFTADEIKEVIEKENPRIFFNNADSYHYIMDFSFEKDGKKYWIESKNIEGDFSKFELNIYEGFYESVAGSLVKELTLFESKEVRTMIEGSEEKPAEMEKAKYDEIKPIKPEVDENGKKAEKELKEAVEDENTEKVTIIDKDGNVIKEEKFFQPTNAPKNLRIAYTKANNFAKQAQKDFPNCKIVCSHFDVEKGDYRVYSEQEPIDTSIEESRADKIRKGAYKRVKHESIVEYQVVVRDVYGSNAIIRDAKDLQDAKNIKDRLKQKYKKSPVYIIKDGKIIDESLNEEGAGDFKYQIGDMIKMTRKAQAEGRRLFGADFKAIKGEVINRFNGGIDMPNVYTVKMADGSEETVAETLVEFWGTKRKKEPVGESVKNPIESIHTGRNIYIKLNPEFENISLSELFKIIELGGTEETNSFWRTVIREKRGHITIKRNENESNELMFYPNTWKDKNFKIKTVAGVPFEDTFHAYGFAKNESFEDKTVNEEEKTYYLYAGYYELYLTDHKLTPPYMYQAENTDLNQLINDNISEIDDEGEWTNPDAAFSTDSATICFDKNIIDELNKTDLFGGEIDMYHDALSDAEFNGEDEDKVKEDYHIYDLSKYYADKNESLNEISLESAKAVNDKRQFNSLKADLKANMTNSEDDREEADKLADKSTKSNKLLQRWKKAKGIEESAQVVVATFDEGLHEIVKCDKGYFNRYNIKDGKARFTTKCVESLPTAVGALKRRFPNASEDIDVNESLNEEFINFEGYRFKGIVNPKTGEIIYSTLSPKYGNILNADLRININDKEDFNNREIIKAAKEAITKE